MNKKILATAITALLATSAQAANIYDADGMTVDVNGGVEVMYGKTSTVKNSDTAIRIDDADINFTLGYDLGNDVSALGVIALDSASDTAKVDNTYVGLSHATMGTLTIGKQPTILDDAGIFSDHELGIDGVYSQINKSTQVIKYKFDNGMFYGGVAYLANNAMNAESDDSAIDGNIGVNVEGFDLTLFAGKEEMTKTTDKTNVVFQVKYAVGDLGLGAYIGSTSGDYKQSGFGLAASYEIGKLGLAAGYSSIDVDGTTDTTDKYVVNVDYAFTSYVSVYAEVGATSVDNTDTAWNTGMIVKF